MGETAPPNGSDYYRLQWEALDRREEVSMGETETNRCVVCGIPLGAHSPRRGIDRCKRCSHLGQQSTNLTREHRSAGGRTRAAQMALAWAEYKRKQREETSRVAQLRGSAD